jgi:SAM-dependent methyltransferase
MTYFLAPNYRERLEPEYFHDEAMDAVWQPDVYPDAATLARLLGSSSIVDLGCGDGAKLAALSPEFRIIGLDIGANLERSREQHPEGTWMEFDLDSEEPLPIDDVAGSVVVCADVLEHLRFPERTLKRARDALDRGADAFVLSTPERDLAEGPNHAGPPRNPAHVREWNAEELRAFLESEGLYGFFGLTRSNDYLDELQTTLVVVPGQGEQRRQVVEAWFSARQRWEELASEHSRKLEHERARAEEFAETVRWYQDQVRRYQSEIDKYALLLKDALDRAGDGRPPLIRRARRKLRWLRAQRARKQA